MYLSDLSAIRTATKGIECLCDGEYTTVVGDALGQYEIYVGRVSASQCDHCQVNLWIVSDNVRKGAALSAVLMGELMTRHYL
ncbi:hypothetical protein GOY11_34015 [Pseudomonas aeruginosa]|nr:hypothetical protein [Pseudomonas aeruginosa]